MTVVTVHANSDGNPFWQRPNIQMGKCYESGYSARVLLVRYRKNLSEQVCRSNEFDFSSGFVRVYIMDNDKLVTLVFENRCLWDMKDKNYHNREC
jgi:hypothetical protein